MKLKFLLICVFTAVLGSGLFFTQSAAVDKTYAGAGANKVAYAAEGDIVIERDTVLTSGDFTDINLYNSLLAIVAAENYILTGIYAMPYGFEAGYFSAHTVLNLTNDITNKIGTTDINTNPNKKITSLTGLENLYFDNLQELYLNNNAIRSIDNLEISAANLSKLEIKNNGLVSFEVTIGKLFDALKLNTLNLSYNKLTEIDLSQLEYYLDGGSNRVADVNLSFNDISDKESIIMPLPSYVSVNLDLTGNNLFDVLPSDFAGHNVTMYIQGYRKDKSFTEGDIIKIYEGGITATVLFRSASAFYEAGGSNIAGESGTDGVLTVPAGKVTIVFEEMGTNFTGTEFETRNADVRPQKVTFKVFDIDGTEIETLKEYAKPIDVTLTPVEGRDTFLSLNNGDYQKISTYNLREHGNYQFKFIMAYDGLYSDPTYYSVKIINMSNAVWGLVILVGLTILVITAVFIVRWYRQGGLVAPLSEKEKKRMGGNQNER